MKFPTLKSLIEFVESIPSDKFCVGQVDNDKGQNCVFGHINKAIFGRPAIHSFEKELPIVEETMEPIKVNIARLILANNADNKDPKRGALKYLNSLL